MQPQQSETSQKVVYLWDVGEFQAANGACSTGQVLHTQTQTHGLVIGSESKVTWLRLVNFTSACCLCMYGAPEGCPCTTARHFPACQGWSIASGSGSWFPSPRCPGSRTHGSAGPSTACLCYHISLWPAERQIETESNYSQMVKRRKV